MLHLLLLYSPGEDGTWGLVWVFGASVTEANI